MKLQETRNSNYEVKERLPCFCLLCLGILGVSLIVGEPPKNSLASEPEEIRASEEKHRPALESANRAGDQPGEAFFGQLIPLKK